MRRARDAGSRRWLARGSTGLGKAMVGLLENEPGQAVVDALRSNGRIGIDNAVSA